MSVCKHGHIQPLPFMCHGLTKKQSNTQEQYTPESDTVRAAVVWLYSLSSLPLSSSSPPPFSFFPPWFGRGAASCARALLLGHFCPTWWLQARGTGMRYVYGTVAICSGLIFNMMQYGGASVHPVGPSYCSENPVGVAALPTYTEDP